MSMMHEFRIHIVKEAPGGLITEWESADDYAKSLDRLAALERNATVQQVEIFDPEGTKVEAWQRDGLKLIDMGSFKTFLDVQDRRER